MFYQERASWQNCCDAVEKLHITAVRWAHWASSDTVHHVKQFTEKLLGCVLS